MDGVDHKILALILTAVGWLSREIWRYRKAIRQAGRDATEILNQKKAGRLLQGRVWDGLPEQISPSIDTTMKLPLIENRQLETA